MQPIYGINTCSCVQAKGAARTVSLATNDACTTATLCRMGLIDVGLSSIAQSRKVFDSGCNRSCSAFVLAYVICNAEFIANLKQMIKIIRISYILVHHEYKQNNSNIYSIIK
jgi:hypothetical protein